MQAAMDDIHLELNHVDTENSDMSIGGDSRFSSYRHRTVSLQRNSLANEMIGLRTMGRYKYHTNTLRSIRSPEDADTIVNQIQENVAKADDEQQADQLRREALRDMPQSLTIKRQVKQTLMLNEKSRGDNHSTIGCYKWAVYSIIILYSKLKASIYNFLYTFELWYLILKTLEGQFGSAVATFFRFFRSLFFLNLFTLVPTFFFIVLPQILQSNFGDEVVVDQESFSPADIFTGEGSLTNSVLFYGRYTNETIKLAKYEYDMPYAYLFTMFVTYVIGFIVLSYSTAKSFRKNFIETKGGSKNVFAHKIFCSWDFGIATEDAATLKSSVIYHELRELLDQWNSPRTKASCASRFFTVCTNFAVNLLILFVLMGIAFGMWILLDKNRLNDDNEHIGMITAVVINVTILVFPLFFTIVGFCEDYKSPRNSFFVNLTRTILLEIVVIGILVAYWITSASKVECWETCLGQEIYRLVIFEFIFSIVFLPMTEIVRFLLNKNFPSTFDPPEFNINRYTLQILYNQTLFWIGLYFSPLLSAIVVLKLFVSWYLTTFTVLHCCKPSSKTWRAAQTETLFLIMAFLNLIMVMTCLGYVVASVETSGCGPFRSFEYVYNLVKEGILGLEQGQTILKTIIYVTKPGVVALIILMMCMGVYYLDAKSRAQDAMVKLLRNMLINEAKDKEFLLTRISLATQGRYNLQENPLEGSPMRQRRMREDLGDSGTEVLLPSHRVNI